MPRLLWLLSALFFVSSVNAAEPSFSERKDVQQFIVEMSTQHHFKADDLAQLFNTVELKPSSTTKGRVTPSIPWFVYQRVYLSQRQIQAGLQFWQRYADVLAQAEQRFGVPAHVIVATIGVETKYGRLRGKYPVFATLAKLAFGKSKRNQFFKHELAEFLLLTREQHLQPLTVFGSAAGAIGQPQFMPSSYRHYAINFSGNANIDLSNNMIDIIGSIANYYHKNGWKTGAPIAIPLSRVGGNYQYNWFNQHTITLSDLYKQRMVSNQTIDNTNYRLIALRKDFGNEYWIAFHNFNVIRRYNHSDLYAMSVYQLSYYILALRGNTLCLRKSP